MTTLRRILVLAVLGTIASTGLLIAPSFADPASYHQSSSGDTVRLTRGETLKVDLRTASGTAFYWQVVKGKHTSKFKIVSRRTHGDGSGLPGAPYNTIWTIRGKHAGTATFKVVLRDQDGHVARRFTLHIRVVRTVLACGRADRAGCVSPS